MTEIVKNDTVSLTFTRILLNVTESPNKLGLPLQQRNVLEIC